MSVFLISDFLIMELFTGGAEQYAINVVERLFCNSFHIQRVRAHLKGVSLCNDLVRETSGKELKAKIYEGEDENRSKREYR